MGTCLAPSPRTLRELVNPTEKQLEFLQAVADYDFVLYGGEAGGGKSYILRWWLVLFLFDCWETLGLRNVRVGLFSQDYPTLEDRQISKIQFEFPDWLGRLARDHKGGLNFVLHSDYGAGVICLRNLDKPSKYKSAEFAAIALEEVTENPISVFSDLRFRLRWPGIKRPKFAGGTNPGDIGHEWVKNYWIKKKYPPEFRGIHPVTKEPYDITGQFAFVRAKASDNEHVDPSYHVRNLTLPPEMANRVARGDWDVFTGQYFPHFEAESTTDLAGKVHPPRHVISQAEALKRIKPWHTRFLSGDWGYDHPFAIYKHAKDEHNRIITYGELWGRLIAEQEVGRRIGELCRPERTPGHPLYTQAGFQSFAFSWDAGKASPRSQGIIRKAITTLVQEGMPKDMIRPHPADSSPGSRIARARLTSQLLTSDMLTLTEECPKLIACIPSLIRDEDNTEDVLKVDYTTNEIGDDPYDGASMGWQNEFGSTIIPATVVADRRVAAFAESRGKELDEMDINTVAQLHRRALADEQRKRRKRRGGLGPIWRPQTGQ